MKNRKRNQEVLTFTDNAKNFIFVFDSTRHVFHCCFVQITRRWFRLLLLFCELVLCTKFKEKYVNGLEKKWIDVFTYFWLVIRSQKPLMSILTIAIWSSLTKVYLLTLWCRFLFNTFSSRFDVHFFLLVSSQLLW